jgi:hypothetical protein
MEEETFAQVQQLYDQTEFLSADDRVILDMPIEDRLQLPLPTLQHWVKITEPTISQCICTFSQQMEQQV